MHKVGIIPPTAAAESDDVMYSQMLEPLHIQSINFLPLFPSWETWPNRPKTVIQAAFCPAMFSTPPPFLVMAWIKQGAGKISQTFWYIAAQS